MPALPRLRIAALAELANQLRFESPEAARQQLERTEALALEVLAERQSGGPEPRTYPLDYIVFRITGLRTDGHSGQASVLIGEALLADLPAMVERLSAAANIHEVELLGQSAASVEPGSVKTRVRSRRINATTPARSVLAPPWLDLDSLARRWGLGRKSIERLRRRGLLARRVRMVGPDRARESEASVRGAAARQKLLFSLTAVEAFEASGLLDGPPSRERSAARTPRVSDAERRRWIRRARRYRARFHWSLNRTAARLAATHDRSIESVRRVLRAHDQRSDPPIFDERPPLNEHERNHVDRVRSAGGSAAAVGRRLGRSRATVYRVAAKLRAERLSTLELSGPVTPLMMRSDADEVFLAPPSVNQGLGRAAPASIGEFLALADAQQPPPAAIESARGVALAFLRCRAARRIAQLDRHRPAAAALDAIETDLRWASRIKAELVRSLLAVALRSIRARLDGRGPESLPPRGPGGGPALIHDCIGALIEAVDRFDPFKSLAAGESGAAGRLAAPATIAVNRAVTRWLQRQESAGRPGLTAPMISSATAQRTATPTLQDWTLRVDPWQAWLELPEQWVRQARDQALDEAPALLCARWGFGGRPPQTLANVAAELGTTASRLAALERRIILGKIASRGK